MSWRRSVKRLIRPWIARPVFQPFWKSLYSLSKLGMNFGGGYGFTLSGELWVIGFVDKLLTNSHGNNLNVIVFDVGAHDGAYGSHILNLMQNKVKLYCFEPLKQNFEDLKKRLGNAPNVQLLNFGLGDKEELTTLYFSDHVSRMSSVYRRNLDHDYRKLCEAQQIKLRKLDDFCKDEGIAKINFLKLDVEGHELPVLEGAKKMINSNSIDLIQFEFGECNVDSKTYFQDFFYLLKPYYKIYRILQHGLDRIEEYSYENEVFRVTNYLAISKTIKL